MAGQACEFLAYEGSTVISYPLWLLTFSTILPHWVPFPAAGAPAIITRKGLLGCFTTSGASTAYTNQVQSFTAASGTRL